MPPRILVVALVITVAAFGEFVAAAFAASPPVATFPTAREPSSAVLFNGTSSMVAVGDTGHLELSHAMTLEASVRPSSTLSGRRDIIVKTRSRGRFPYGLELTNGVPDAYATIGGKVVRVSASSALALGNSSFVAADYNGHILRLYVDRRLVAVRSARGDLSTSQGPVEIGGDSVWGRHYRGMIDHVRIYTRSLSITRGKHRARHPRPTTTTATTAPSTTTSTSPTATAAATPGNNPPALSANANIWLSTAGGSCTRRSTPGSEISGHDCGSLNAAYQAASCGDIVNIDAGNYGNQELYTDPSLAACASPVVIEPGPGVSQSQVIFDNIDSGHIGQDPTMGASNWTMQDITIQSEMTLMAPAEHDVLNDVQGGTMYISGAQNFTLENSNMGPCYNTLPGPNLAIKCQSNFKIDPDGTVPAVVTTNINIVHDYFHDFIDNTNNPATDHDECVFINGGTNITFDSDKFSVCQLYAIFLQPYSGVPFVNLLIENNWFSGTENSGSNADEYGTPRNTAVEFGSNGPIGIDSTIVRYNSFAADEGITQSTFGNTHDSGDAIIGNILGNGGCNEGLAYGYNVMINEPACGAGDTEVASVPYVDSASTPEGANDFHLTGSFGQNFVSPNMADYQLNYDLDGNLRPSSGPRDVGSEQ